MTLQKMFPQKFRKPVDSRKNKEKLNLIGIHTKKSQKIEGKERKGNLIAQIDLQQKREPMFCTLEKSLCSDDSHW